MQDLVGVRIADPAEQAGVGQCTLQRVVLAGEPLAERRELGRHHIDAARVHRVQCFAACEQMQRRATLSAGLGEQQRPAIELESRERNAARRLGAHRQPAQASRDHQMDDEEQSAVEHQHDALAEALDTDDAPALGLGDGRHCGAQQEGIEHADALQRAAAQLRVQALHVDGDVGQLRHERQCATHHR